MPDPGHSPDDPGGPGIKVGSVKLADLRRGKRIAIDKDETTPVAGAAGETYFPPAHLTLALTADRRSAGMARAVRAKVKSYRLWLAAVVPLVIVGGFLSPLFGLVVPAVMAAALTIAFSGRGRFFCGNWCPRGSFLDGWVARIPGLRLPSPDLKKARWYVTAALMAFTAWRISQNPGDPRHWGGVFWTMCLVTTVAALVLAALYRHRAWCMVCPVGSLSTLAKTTDFAIPVPKGCRGCKVCDRACPINLEPVKGIHGTNECLQCGACTSVCPAVKLPKAA